MRVVSDTSVISNLAIIGRLEFLRKLYENIAIAPAVAAELDRLRHPAAGASIASAFAEGWLTVAPLAGPAPPWPNLHPGETESLALALQEEGTLLLMDETDGRAAARDLGLALTGVVGVLVAARRTGWISSLKDELLRLRLEARFFISERFFVEALALVGESL